jgi:hypothetical protein
MLSWPGCFTMYVTFKTWALEFWNFMVQSSHGFKFNVFKSFSFLEDFFMDKRWGLDVLAKL